MSGRESNCCCSPVSGPSEECPDHGLVARYAGTHEVEHIVFRDDCARCVDNQVRAQHVMLRWLAGETS